MTLHDKQGIAKVKILQVGILRRRRSLVSTLSLIFPKFQNDIYRYFCSFYEEKINLTSPYWIDSSSGKVSNLYSRELSIKIFLSWNICAQLCYCWCCRKKALEPHFPLHIYIHVAQGRIKPNFPELLHPSPSHIIIQQYITPGSVDKAKTPGGGNIIYITLTSTLGFVMKEFLINRAHKLGFNRAQIFCITLKTINSRLLGSD